MKKGIFVLTLFQVDSMLELLEQHLSKALGRSFPVADMRALNNMKSFIVQ